MLTPDQQASLRQAIASGRFRTDRNTVREALAFWVERERTRAELLAAVDEAEASLARGEGRPVTEDSMRALAEDIKRRVHERLAADTAGA